MIPLHAEFADRMQEDGIQSKVVRFFSTAAFRRTGWVERWILGHLSPITSLRISHFVHSGPCIRQQLPHKTLGSTPQSGSDRY